MKIVIVGGGTAGWISALMLSKITKSKNEIVLIESQKIKSIGVGEGSTGFLRGIINNEVWDYGCNELEFMNYTNSTPKLAVVFKDWQKVDTQYIEPIDAPYNSDFLNSYSLPSAYFSNGIDFSLSSIDGRLINNELSPFYLNEGQILHDGNHAHHFDAKLAAEYFEQKCSKDITKIYEDIVDFELDDLGNVTNLNLSNGEKIFGDFFIDASGFSRIFSKKMNVKFIPFEEMTLNSAIPFRLETDQYPNTNFYTTAWAQKYGWMWMIPKIDNIGCGYIYDDNYIDEDGAKKEIEEKLKTEINVIKKISFKAGRLEKPWNKNVLSLGLSFQFLEPLEATSIHGTISQLNSFIFFHLKDKIEDTINEKNIENYNENMINMVEDFRTFILFHYLNSRRDTEFWEKMHDSAKNNDRVTRISNIFENRLLQYFDCPSPYGGISNELYNWVAYGMNHFSDENAKKQMTMLKNKKYAQNEEYLLCEYIQNKNWISSKDFIETIKNYSIQ